MSKQPYKNLNPRTSLSAATLDSVDATYKENLALSSLFPKLQNVKIPKSLVEGDNGNLEAITKVLSASLLVTGNTVGSGMFVLPEAVGGVGMIWGTTIFFGENEAFIEPKFCLS